MASRRDANCACHCDARKYTHDPTNNASLICWRAAVYGFGVADGIYFSDLRSPEPTGGENRKCDRRSNGPKRWSRKPNPLPRLYYFYTVRFCWRSIWKRFFFFFKNRVFWVSLFLTLNTVLVSRKSTGYCS